MSDAQTLAVYAQAAQRYAKGVARTRDLDQHADIARLMALMPETGLVLDLGCGPGQYAAALKAAGLTVEASDASPEMIALAQRDYGVTAWLASFEMLDDDARYDAIWANFSLLHASRSALPGLLTRIHRALKPRGALHLGMKLGYGESRDDLGRFFAYYTEAELRGLLTRAGFNVTHTRTGAGTGLAGIPDTYVILLSHA